MTMILDDASLTRLVETTKAAAYVDLLRAAPAAWDGETAVAGAALYVLGDAGWLGAASTLPSARGRGAQGALMARRIEDGRAFGCRWFVTETGEETAAHPNPSLRNMMRAGFRVAYHRENFMPPA
jgi:GNAT superfamily N-acetyltransferase